MAGKPVAIPSAMVPVQLPWSGRNSHRTPRASGSNGSPPPGVPSSGPVGSSPPLSQRATLPARLHASPQPLAATPGRSPSPQGQVPPPQVRHRLAEASGTASAGSATPGRSPSPQRHAPPQALIRQPSPQRQASPPRSYSSRCLLPGTLSVPTTPLPPLASTVTSRDKLRGLAQSRSVSGVFDAPTASPSLQPQWQEPQFSIDEFLDKQKEHSERLLSDLEARLSQQQQQALSNVFASVFERLFSKQRDHSEQLLRDLEGRLTAQYGKCEAMLELLETKVSASDQIVLEVERRLSYTLQVVCGTCTESVVGCTAKFDTVDRQLRALVAQPRACQATPDSVDGKDLSDVQLADGMSSHLTRLMHLQLLLAAPTSTSRSPESCDGATEVSNLSENSCMDQALAESLNVLTRLSETRHTLDDTGRSIAPLVHKARPLSFETIPEAEEPPDVGDQAELGTPMAWG